MRFILLFLVVAFISGCAGTYDSVRSSISDVLSTNKKATDEPRETTLNTSVSKPDGVPKDYKEAVALYRRSAEQGDANAQNNLGDMYRKGQGVPQDYKEAATWYRKSAEQGNASAQNSLGDMYRKGQGVRPSRVLAYALYNLSAANDPSSTNIATGHRTFMAGNMAAQEIDAAQNLTREMARPNNLLIALDNYVRHPSVQE